MTFQGKYNSYPDLVESTIGKEYRKTLLELALEFYFLLCDHFESAKLDRDTGDSVRSQIRMGGNGF